jgi:hypothetical protein
LGGTRFYGLAVRVADFVVAGLEVGAVAVVGGGGSPRTVTSIA